MLLQNPTSTTGNCWASWNHQDTNMKAPRTQATFPLQCSYVSKMSVSSHASISVLLLLSWQLENTQSPTPISAAGSTNWEGRYAGGWQRLPCSTAPGQPCRDAHGLSSSGSTPELGISTIPSPRVSINHKHSACWGCFDRCPDFFFPSFTAGTFWCFQTIFFLNLASLRKFLV